MNLRLLVLLLIPILLLDIEIGFAQQDKSPETVTGYVYEDENKNGEKDPEEEGIADVMVSNQKDVVLTDEEGAYELPVEENTIISISKPADYKFEKNENNLPQFYYVHKPDGSPDLKYEGFEATGSIPNPLNFALIPSQKKTSFKAIVFGDPQPRTGEDLSYYRDDVLSELAGTDADLTLVLGDIMFDDLSLYPRYNRMMKTLGMPIFNLFGNHDINFDTDGNKHARETFKKQYGPTYFSFEQGDVHFIALNNIDYLGEEEDYPPYRGYIDSRQLEWVENTVEHIDDDKLIVLLSHIPMYSDGESETQNIVNRDELLEIFGDRENLLYLSGHRHRIFHHFLDDEIDSITPNTIHHMALTAASGAWWGGPKDHRGIPITHQRDGVPNGYHIFEFDGNSYKERYKGAGHAKDHQIRIERPKSSLTLEEYEDSEFMVNVFNGNERSKVLFRISGTIEWREMEQMDRAFSPYLEDITDGDIKPGYTPHFWTADLPDLDKGIHKIEVVTRDMYGKEYRKTKVIEID